MGDYEYIVLGCGGIGSAALYWLSKLSSKPILGIEQFKVGHHAGGSQDHSRIIRLAYNNPNYTRLAPHSFTAWAAVESESDSQLVLKCGSLQIGRKDDKEVEAYAIAMREMGIPFEDFTGTQAMKRWPQLNLSDNDRVLFQADGGIVDARRANATHISLALAHGAKLIEDAKVSKVEPMHQRGAKVFTSKGVFTCKKLVISAGAWTNEILSSFDIHLPLFVLKEQVNYYSTPNLRDFSPRNFPVWLGHTTESGKEHCYYGFPVYGEVATKAGLHNGGVKVDPNTRNFEPDIPAREKVENYLKTYIPGSLGPLLYTKSCLYTCTPDEHFVLDTLPKYPQVSVFVGAGHAYKFACLIGLILAQIAINGKTSYPIKFFSISRPALGLGSKL